jgi:hypothetical protein
MNWPTLSLNEKELCYVFLPNIAIGLGLETYEKFIDVTAFGKESLYFNNLYLCKFASLFIFVLAYRQFKNYLPRYAIILIAYLFNILVILSDNSNINEFKETKKEHEGTTYYKILNFRIYINYIFLFVWMVVILAKVKKWIKKYKSCDIEVERKKEE